MVDKAKALIIVYSLIGLTLFLIGTTLIYQFYNGTLKLEGISLYGTIAAAVFAMFLGLHWFVVGLASLKEG